MRHKLVVTAVAWLVAGLMFFPIFWMFLTGFKTEVDALSPSCSSGPPWRTTSRCRNGRTTCAFAWNSVVISASSTLLALALAIPAAYAMAFFPTRRTKDLLLWMLSTKMMPAVGVLVPIYLLCRDTGLLDTRMALLVIYALINLPIVVWMLYTFFAEVPREVLEAARMDGARTRDEFFHVLLPLSLPGIVSTSLFAIIFAWNEAFWSLNLTTTNAAPLTAFIASFSSPEGLFWAKLSAASTVAIAPIVAFGWMSQRQLVRGLTFGAVK
jgi:sorbitol/mannitol transport system permease protein